LQALKASARNWSLAFSPNVKSLVTEMFSFAGEVGHPAVLDARFQRSTMGLL